MSDSNLIRWRQDIDELDQKIVELLNMRARLAQQIGAAKQRDIATNTINTTTGEVALHPAVYRPEREAQVLSYVGARNAQVGGPLLTGDLHTIYREIMSACRALEQRISVAFLGPVGTFSEQAAYRLLGHAVDLQPCNSIDDAFRACAAGSADFAVVPIENSSEGAINRSLDLLLTTSLTIQAEVSLSIQHCVMNQSGQGADIRAIAVHPQALAQCRLWLAQNFPGIETVIATSNAEAARQAQLDSSIAAIAGEVSMSLYQLNMVARNIQDDPHNQTRFALIGPPVSEQVVRAPQLASSPRYQTSLILSVDNVAGAVYRLLQPLDQYGVSMTRFESRPARGGSWAYYFYVDIEGHHKDSNVNTALAALASKVAFYKNLGSYPVYGAKYGIDQT